MKNIYLFFRKSRRYFAVDMEDNSLNEAEFPREKYRSIVKSLIDNGFQDITYNADGLRVGDNFFTWQDVEAAAGDGTNSSRWFWGFTVALALRCNLKGGEVK